MIGQNVLPINSGHICALVSETKKKQKTYGDQVVCYSQQHKKSSTNILLYVCTACPQDVRSCPTKTYTPTHCKVNSYQLYIWLSIWLICISMYFTLNTVVQITKGLLYCITWLNTTPLTVPDLGWMDGMVSHVHPS